MRKVACEEAWKVSEKPSRIALAVSLNRNNDRRNIIVPGWKMRTSFKPPMAAVSVGIKKTAPLTFSK